VKVISGNQFGDSIISDPGSGATINVYTSAPTSLTATADQSQVTLSWVEPSNNGGSPVLDYSLYYKVVGVADYSFLVDGIIGNSYVATVSTYGFVVGS
jgi:hypothetical protein